VAVVKRRESNDGQDRTAVRMARAADGDADASALLDWAFGSYRWIHLSAQTEGALKLAPRLGIGNALVRSLINCS
jgi:hypothetical protein